MRTFEHNIDIAASTADVWALTIDVESWPSLFPTVTAVERLDGGPIKVGSRARIKQPGQPARVWTVTEVAAEQRFVWTARAAGFTMTGVHTMTPTADGGTTNKLTLELDGPLAGLIAALAGRKLRQTLATENDGFRRAVQPARTHSP